MNIVYEVNSYKKIKFYLFAFFLLIRILFSIFFLFKIYFYVLPQILRIDLITRSALLIIGGVVYCFFIILYPYFNLKRIFLRPIIEKIIINYQNNCVDIFYRNFMLKELNFTTIKFNDVSCFHGSSSYTFGSTYTIFSGNNDSIKKLQQNFFNNTLTIENKIDNWNITLFVDNILWNKDSVDHLQLDINNATK